MIFLIALSVMLTIGLLVYAVIPQTGEMERRLATFGGEMGQSAKHILIFDGLYNAEKRGQMTKRLLEGGWYKTTPGQYMAYQYGLAGGGFAVGLLITLLVHLPLMAVAFFVLVGFLSPTFALGSATKKRKLSVQCEIPDFLDAIATAVSAGVALNAAMLSAVEISRGPLGDEFRATLADIRMGRGRAEAMKAMASRVNQSDLSQLITAIVQSEQVGGNIAQVLEELASEARNRRFTRAEELAAVLPLKMTIPMAFFLLPALFTMIFAPVAAGLMAAQGS